MFTSVPVLTQCFGTQYATLVVEKDPDDLIWECALVDVGVSEQRTLFLGESTEARITCPNQKLVIGGRTSWCGGKCVKG